MTGSESMRSRYDFSEARMISPARTEALTSESVVATPDAPAAERPGAMPSGVALTSTHLGMADGRWQMADGFGVPPALSIGNLPSAICHPEGRSPSTTLRT